MAIQVGALPRTAVAIAFAVALAVSNSSMADAKPKRQDKIRGCTMAQLQSSKFDSCMKKHDDDMMAGRSLIHQPYCASNGGFMCCVERNGVVQSCEVIRAFSPDAGGGRLRPGKATQ
ncbi:hypothetical protein [Ciceribacter azotifigens]|uniref:hypothetical protein n=1 Tax=Ciceribacter azotifigens TaxID=2069303 RepID=UPI003A8BA46D